MKRKAPSGTSMPDAYAVNTLDFAESDGRTTLTLLVQHQNQEHRDAHVESGMEGGMQRSYDRVEELLASGDVA